MKPLGDVALDTSIVVAHLRGDATITDALRAATRIFLPWAALGELYFGMLRSAEHAKQVDALRRFLEAATVLDATSRTARHYATIRAGLWKRGMPIPENDIWIAARAIEDGLPLAARDGHFAQVAGLTLLEW